MVTRSKDPRELARRRLDYHIERHRLRDGTYKVFNLSNESVRNMKEVWGKLQANFDALYEERWTNENETLTVDELLELTELKLEYERDLIRFYEDSDFIARKVDWLNLLNAEASEAEKAEFVDDYYITIMEPLRQAKGREYSARVRVTKLQRLKEKGGRHR